MRLLLLFIAVCAISTSTSYAQANFLSNGSGNWNSASRWILSSGSDSDGIPDSNDNVTIQSGHNVSISAAQACNNLTFNNGTISFNSNNTLTINGNVSVIANSTVSGYSNNHIFNVLGGLTINSGIQLTVGANTFSIAGTTTINGTLAISGYGAKPRNFADLIINSGATMSVAGADLYTFSGNITNNGTFTANDQTEFRFTGSSKTISGSGNISMYKAVFNSPGSYVNNGNLTVRNSMSGTGSFTNGAGGTLELQNGGPFSVTSFDASATGNTITYTGYGNPTSFTGNYYNLTLNKSSGNLSFGGSLSVLNDLKVQSGILTVNAVTLTVGNDLIVEGGEFTPDNASGIVNIGGGITMTGGQYDHNSGQVNADEDFVVTGGEFLLDGASSFLNVGGVSLTGVSLTLNSGTITSTGDFDINTGAAFNNPGATISAAGTFSVNDGTATFPGGSLTAGAVFIASGKQLTLTNVTTNVSGAATINGTLSFNGSSGTKSFGSVSVASGGTWSVTQPNNFSISGNITNNGTFTGDPGYGTSVYTLTSSNGQISGTSGLSVRDIAINSPASYTNNTSLTVANTLNGTGTFINGASGTLTYKGDNSAGSNFTISNFNASAVGNTVVYAGVSSSQRWKQTVTANNDYYNVTLNFNTGDYQRLQLNSNIRVNGTLNIIEGDPVLNTYNLEMAAGASITGGDADDYIRINSSGKVRQFITSTGSSYFYPLGDNSNSHYSPISSFVLTSATLGANPYIDFSVTDAVHPNRNTSNTASGGDDSGIATTAYLSRYWTVSGNDISSPKFSASYQYIDDDVNGTEANMVAVLRRQVSVGASTIQDWLVAGAVNPSNNTVSLSKGDGFGVLYAMDDNGGRLPIQLLSFDANVIEGEISLNWETESEENNDFFTIEHSSNGIDFKPILYQDGAGSSSDLKKYQMLDHSPNSGWNYYRLKQTDFNGQYEYSEIISAFVERSKEISEQSIQVYPNAVSVGNDLNIQLKNFEPIQNITVKLISLEGEEIQKLTTKTFDNITFVINEGIKTGYYLLIVLTPNFKSTERIIVK